MHIAWVTDILPQDMAFRSQMVPSTYNTSSSFKFSGDLSLPLMLELGRYRRPKVPRTEKICTICGSEVEDEIHFMLRCPALVNTRRPILGECVKLSEDFLLHTDMEKFYFLLNNCNVNLVAKTIFQMFQLRRSLL